MTDTTQHGAGIALVGVGRLGAPIAERLLARHRPLSLVVRNDSNRRGWADRGVPVVADAGSIDRGTDVLVVAVRTEEQAREVVMDALSRLGRDAIVLLHTTVSIDVLAGLTAAGSEHGVLIADAPLDGSPDDAANGRILALLGGEDVVADRVRPVLECYADPVVRTGGPGTAARVKLVASTLFAAHLQAAFVAVEACRALGIDSATAIRALRSATTESTALRLLEAVGGDSTVLSDLVRPFTAVDVPLAARSAEAAGVSLEPLLTIVRNGSARLL